MFRAFGSARSVALTVTSAVALLLALPTIAVPASQTVNALPPTDKEIVDSPVYKPPPEYPDRAVLANIEGSIRVAVTIGPDGRVTKAEVIAAEPPGWFDDAALAAIKTWRYRAPRRELTFEVAIDFTLP